MSADEAAAIKFVFRIANGRLEIQERITDRPFDQDALFVARQSEVASRGFGDKLRVAGDQFLRDRLQQ